jgi:DNA-directed RNA polymerase I, II, and III subunit RPABC2
MNFQSEHKEPNEINITTPFITKFEQAQMLGIRSEQIAAGSPTFIDIENETDSLKIAKKEIEQGLCSITIRRDLPDGSYELWKNTDLIVPK